MCCSTPRAQEVKRVRSDLGDVCHCQQVRVPNWFIQELISVRFLTFRIHHAFLNPNALSAVAESTGQSERFRGWEDYLRFLFDFVDMFKLKLQSKPPIDDR
jgi:hypothetical protein